MKIPPNLEKLRTNDGFAEHTWKGTATGRFRLPTGERSHLLIVVSEDHGLGWEHVSVSAHYRNAHDKRIERTPTWEEMCLVKDMFWDAEEAVMQLHPPKSDYVNNREHVLHLWRPTQAEIPRPPSVLVGIKGFKIVDNGPGGRLVPDPACPASIP